MFELEVDDRLTAWADLRRSIDSSLDPLQELVNFWVATPFHAHNHEIDPYYPQSWPTPWDIVVANKYDDFTKAIMIGYTLLLTDRYKNSLIQIKTLVDSNFKRLYNVVYVDDTWALNYDDTKVVSVNNIPSLYSLENLVVLERPR